MKIEVGKTYKDGNGNDVLIECKLTNPLREGFPYLGTFESQEQDGSYHWCAYNEKGENNIRDQTAYDLKEKPIEGYVNIYENGYIGRVHQTREKALASKIGYYYVRTAKVLEAGDE